MIPNLLYYSTTQVGTAVANDSSELALAAIGTTNPIPNLSLTLALALTLTPTLTLTLSLPSPQ